MSPQHLPTQTAEVALADLVSVPIALGYRHVVFAHTQPGKQAARPSGNVFERLGATGELPVAHTCEDGDELSFDKALFNWLRNQCDREQLGVRVDEV